MGAPLNWWWSGTPAGNGGVLEISPTLLFWLLLPLKPNKQTNKNFQFSWLQSQEVDYLETGEGTQPPGSQQGGVVRVRTRGSGCTWRCRPPPYDMELVSALLHPNCQDRKASGFTCSQSEKLCWHQCLQNGWKNNSGFSHCGAKCNHRCESTANGTQEPCF